VKLPCNSIDAATAASIIRITGGNFRLLNRLLAQIERILEINALQQVTKAVVEAERESLVIGQAQRLREGIHFYDNPGSRSRFALTERNRKVTPKPPPGHAEPGRRRRLPTI